MTARRRRVRSVLASIVAAMLATALAGCADIPPIDRLGEPVIVQGDVLDDAGRPLAGAEVRLGVYDVENAVEVADVIWETTVITDDDGRYVIRGLPTPAVLAFVDGEPSVPFDMLAVHVDRTLSGAWSFSRDLDGATWAGDPPVVRLTTAK